MHIVKKQLLPSREDAVRMTRNERLAMLWFGNAVSTLEELKTDIAQRLEMIPDGKDRLEKLFRETDDLMNDVLATIPINQRTSLENTKHDYDVRLAPKLSSFSTNIVMTCDEFKALVDIARTKCRECAENDETCTGCELYTLLTSILPLDDYSGLLCPYNLGEWAN